MLIPACSAARVPLNRTGRPRRSNCPSKAGMTPDRIFISVLLPAPFSPTMAWSSPPKMSIDTSFRATTPGKRLEMCSIEMIGVMEEECSRFSQGSAAPAFDELDQDQKDKGDRGRDGADTRRSVFGLLPHERGDDSGDQSEIDNRHHTQSAPEEAFALSAGRPQLRKGDRDHNDATDDHSLINIRPGLDDLGNGVDDGPQKKDAEDGARNRAHAALQAAAPDDRRGNGIEFIALAQSLGIGPALFADIEYSRDRRQQRADAIRQPFEPVGVN